MTSRHFLIVRRPEGHTERIEITDKIRAMGIDCVPTTLLETFRKATKEAGRGWIVRSETDRTAPVPMTAAERALVEVMKLQDAAERAYDRDPASSFAARDRADKALSAWKEQYPEAAAGRADKIAAEKAQLAAERAERTRNSYVARGLD